MHRGSREISLAGEGPERAATMTASFLSMAPKQLLYPSCEYYPWHPRISCRNSVSAGARIIPYLGHSFFPSFPRALLRISFLSVSNLSILNANALALCDSTSPPKICLFGSINPCHTAFPGCLEGNKLGRHCAIRIRSRTYSMMWPESLPGHVCGRH